MTPEELEARYGGLRSGRHRNWSAASMAAEKRRAAGNLLGSPSLHRGKEPSLPPKLADLESASLEKAREQATLETVIPKITAREKPGGAEKTEQAVRREPKQPDLAEPLRKETATPETPESLGTETGIRADLPVQSSSRDIAEGVPPNSTVNDAPRRLPETVGSAESMEAKPARAEYDSRDKEVGQHVFGLKQEKLRRESKRADLGMKFAKAGGALIGRMLGSKLRQATGGIPHEFKSPLMAAVGDMFGGGEDSGGGRTASRVPMFGEGMDATVSSGGGGESGGGGGDLGIKLDRIIELLGQLVQATGKGGVAGTQADGSFAASTDLGQTMARQAGHVAQAAAGASVNESNKDSSSDEMMSLLLQTIMRVAIAAL